MLTSFEQGLIEALFKPNETEVNMNQIPTRLAAKSALFEEPLEEELLGRGWLDLDRKQKRTWIMGTGWMILFLSLIVFILSMIGAGPASIHTHTFCPGWHQRRILFRFDLRGGLWCVVLNAYTRGGGSSHTLERLC